MQHINKINIDNNFLNPDNTSGFNDFRGLLLNSLFAGEYYNNLFLPKIDRLIKKLEKCKENSPSSPDTNIIYNLANNCLSHYKYLNRYITSRLEYNYKTKIYNFEYEEVFYKTLIFDVEISQNDAFHWLIVTNIKLAEIDEGYCVDEKTTYILAEIFHKLDKIKNSMIPLKFFIEKTIEKCSILLYKILKRLQKNDDINYSVFNDNISLKAIEKFIPRRLNIEINNHYHKENKEKISLFDENVSIKKNIDKKELSIPICHKYLKNVKFAKNITPRQFEITIDILKTIDKHFTDKCDKNDNNFIAYKMINYLTYNCKFTFECNYRLQELTRTLKFEKIIEFNKFIQTYNIVDEEDLKNKNFPNFMIYLYVVKFKKELIDNLKVLAKETKSEDSNDFFSLLEELITESFEALNIYKKNLKINQKNKIMPLYIEFEECMIDENTFIDSQYILPTDYEHLLERYDEEWDALKLKENIFYSLTPKPINELAEKLKKEIKDQQYNIITVIGLYASFITFILANVNVLPKLIEYSIGAVFAFMIVFGVVIFYFISSLKLLFTAKRIFTRFSNFIVWTVAGVFLVFGSLFALFWYMDTDFKKEIQEKKTTTTVKTFDMKTGKKQTETITVDINNTIEKKDTLK